MKNVTWTAYAGSGGWWKKGSVPQGQLLTGDQAVNWAEARSRGQRRRAEREDKKAARGGRRGRK